MNLSVAACVAVACGFLVRGQPLTALLIAAACALSYLLFAPPKKARLQPQRLV